nr:hypothetical protein [Tanacetum cinerariifolium]
MSSASSAVTYTFVYTNSEPGRVFWRADDELSDGEDDPVGYPMDRGDDDDDNSSGYDPIYPEYIPLKDEHILSDEEPLPPIVSPTAESLGYVAESDPEEDPKEYKEDETEDDPVGYPMDRGDDGDDDDDNSSGYDVDDEDEDEEEEEEHLASVDSAIVIPIDELASHLREQSPSYHHPPLTLLPLELELAELHEHDTQDLYALLEDAQDETLWIVEEEAYAAQEAWAHSLGLSQTVHHELQTLCEQVYAQEYQLQTYQTQLQLQCTLIQTQQQLHETYSQIQQTEMAGL